MMNQCACPCGLPYLERINALSHIVHANDTRASLSSHHRRRQTSRKSLLN
jgi:hypothetical protein